MKVEDLGSTDGVEDNNKVALIDADTIAYAAACGAEYAEDILGESFYTTEEWAEIVANPQYDEEESCIWVTDVDAAVEMSVDRIIGIIQDTDTGSAELYFTTGKCFRFQVYDMYKGNRKGTRYPAGLPEIKTKLLELYPGKLCEEYEADDAVCMLKRTQPDKYVLCAVDKDVLGAVPGKHRNYYRSERYNIPEKWQSTTTPMSIRFPYLQTLMGDSTDNIPGCPGIGKKRAATLLGEETDVNELWKIVEKTFKSKKLTVKEAIRDMRLVNMNQLDINWKLTLWNPPC